MASGRQLFDAACQFIGEPYSTNPGRTSPTSGYKDCSGLVAAAFEVVQGYELGAYVSVTIFDQSARAGREIPFVYAQHIVGAVILRPQDPYQGWGSAGHIAISDGAGGTCEATPPRVQRLPLSYNAPWSTRAALLVDIDYSNNGEGTPGAPAKPKGKKARMYSSLVIEEYTKSIWVIDLQTCTRVHIKSVEELDSQVWYRNLCNYVAGEKVCDADVHSSSENDGNWGRLWSNCRDVDEFNDVGATSGGVAIDYAALAKAVNDDAAKRMSG